MPSMLMYPLTLVRQKAAMAASAVVVMSTVLAELQAATPAAVDTEPHNVLEAPVRMSMV